jgi:hypothetical protein
MIDEDELQNRRRIFGQKKYTDVPKSEKEAGFLPWEFECLRLSSLLLLTPFSSTINFPLD